MCYVGANDGPARGFMEVDLVYLGLQFMLRDSYNTWLPFHQTQPVTYSNLFS
jgi:hypothetical protein